jgi:hypothetical protein
MMIHPVDHLCEMIASFGPDDAKTFLDFACLGIGCPDKPTGVPETPTTKLHELHHPFTVDDLRKQMMRVIKQMGVDSKLLICGTLYTVLSHYERMGDPQEVSALIDKFLEMKKTLQAELDKPIEERQDKRSDERLEKFMASVDKVMSGKPADRQNGERWADQLKEAWEKWFPEAYWSAWNLYELQTTAPPGFSTDLFFK